MKRIGVASLLFITLPFCYSCNQPQYNVYITGEHFSYKLSSPKAIKNKPFTITFFPDKYYEIDKNSIIEVKVGDDSFPEGVWTYDDSTHVFEINKSMILGDIHITIEPILAQYIISLIPGSWKTDPAPDEGTKVKEIDIAHESPSRVFDVIENIDNFNENCVVIEPKAEFTIKVVGNKKTFYMNPDDYCTNYTITLK